MSEDEWLKTWSQRTHAETQRVKLFVIFFYFNEVNDDEGESEPGICKNIGSTSEKIGLTR